MHIDFKRWGLFFVLLGVIYLIANLMFGLYIVSSMGFFPTQAIMDTKVLIFLGVGTVLNWKELQYFKYNIFNFIKSAILQTYQSIPFLIFISLIFMIPNISNLDRHSLILEGFFVLTSLAIWKSCHR